MPQKNILAIAQRQALNIHLSIALMEKPTTIWQQVDDLLQTLTGYPKFFDDVNFKPPPTPTSTPPPAPPPTPTPTATPTALILSLLEKHSGGLTPHRNMQRNITFDRNSTTSYQRTCQEAVNPCPKKTRQENLRPYPITSTRRHQCRNEKDVKSGI